MDLRLLKAAQLGDVGLLNKLLNEDPLILEKSALVPTAETPLHIAALAGKADFVHEIIIRKPSFACKLNQDGFTPLHIAVAIGYGDVVQELLSFGNKDDVVAQHEDPSRLCLLRDKQGLIPLHYAALKGEVTVIEELVRCCPESLKELTTRGQTVLHLAVKNSQFEAFKALLKKLKGDDVEYFVDVEDNDGNKIYQMAVDSKQLQIVQYLKSHTKMDINSTKICCGTLEEGTESVGLEQMVQFKKTLTNMSSVSEDMLMVVGTFVATVAFQAAISLRQTFSKGDFDMLKNCRGMSLFERKNPCRDSQVLFFFMVSNTASFFATTFLLSVKTVRWIRYPVTTSMILMLSAYMSLLALIYPNNTGAVVSFCSLAFAILSPIFAYGFWSIVGSFSVFIKYLWGKLQRPPTDTSKVEA